MAQYGYGGRFVSGSGNNDNVGPVPDRWMHCPRNSDSFIADKFLAFKTPLDSRYNSQIAVERQFQPDMVFSYVKMYKAKLGLWIDLTNTKRFYNRSVIESHDTRYIKLNCKGHGETPTPEQTQSFIQIVHEYIETHPLDIIGVHCTHGFNRTGFLIVSYMVEKMDCSVEAALMAFSDARPPGIYKDEYIKELYRRYEDEDDAISAPEYPDWCFEFDDRQTEQHNYNSKPYEDNSDFSAGHSHQQQQASNSRKRSLESPATSGYDTASTTNDEDESGGQDYGESSSGEPSSKKKKRKEFINVNAKFMDGVPGVTLVTDQEKVNILASKVHDMCGWKISGFPGCQPVSMDLNNIKFLQKMPYRVSWKADGTRYMMLIVKEGEVYFFDRDNSCFLVNGLRFPSRKDLNQHLRDTLLDGEMVIDKVEGVNIPRYLVYDIICFNGVDVKQMRFYPERLRCVKCDIIDTRHEAMRRAMINKSREPFSVRDKMFWDITQSRALLGPKFAKTLSHEPDGLIFQPSILPYNPGQCKEVLKWKPMNLNSVDFKLLISEEKGTGIVSRKIGLLFVGKLEVPFAQIKYTKTLRDLNDKIIECKFENNAWVFMRERTDKSFPNSFETAQAVCHSIKYPVTTEILMDVIDNHRFVADSEIMPPPQPNSSSSFRPAVNKLM